jgi:hypothetical protein
VTSFDVYSRVSQSLVIGDIRVSSHAGSVILLDQNSLAGEMRRRGNERVSARQGYG